MADSRSKISEWLRQRTPQHLELLDKMRDSLIRHLPVVGVPDREWAKVCGLYLNSWNAMSAEEREKAKLALMARLKSNGQVLTDEEFEQGMRDLALQAVKELSTADLAQELMRRGLTLPSVADGEHDPQ